MVNKQRPLGATAPPLTTTRIVRIPVEVYPYRAGITGGLIGGMAMIPVALIYGLMSGYGVWYPINLVAATIVRSWQSLSPAQLAQFSLIGVLIGLAIHIAVSASLGFLFAVLLPTLPGHPLAWACIVGPILWFGAVYAALPLLNPVMARLVDLPSFALANVLYALVLGAWVERTGKVKADA